MIDIILKMNGAKKYSIWTMMESKNPATGSKINKYYHTSADYNNYFCANAPHINIAKNFYFTDSETNPEIKFNIYAVIQEIGTSKTIKGLSLQPTKNQGDTQNADAVMYSKKRSKLKDRVLFKNLYYEIRGIEDFDNGLLKYYKSSLIKVDNQ